MTRATNLRVTIEPPRGCMSPYLCQFVNPPASPCLCVSVVQTSGDQLTTEAQRHRESLLNFNAAVQRDAARFHHHVVINRLAAIYKRPELLSRVAQSHSELLIITLKTAIT